MEMNEKHEATLKALLAAETLPETVVKFYSRLKKLADRRDVLITDQVLLLVASVAEKMPEVQKTEEETEDERLQEIADEEAVVPSTEKVESPTTPEEVGIPCEVFLNGESQQAIFLEDQPEEVGEVRVRLLGSAEVIMVPENNVKLRE